MAAPRFRDNAKNAFTKTNLFYTKNVFLGIQDPTVFGFKLFFHFDQVRSPLLWGATGNIQEAPFNTAAWFLKAIGDTQRLYYLEKFLYLLSNINSQTPWYFQSISGLKEAWKRDYTKPYIGDDARLDIDCAESVDLRITALMDYYRKACFDWENRREVVPKNLRQFGLSIVLYEARVFNNPNVIAITPPNVPVAFGYGGNLGGKAGISNAELVERLTGTDETLNDTISPHVNTILGPQMSTTRNMFTFDFCEFDMEEASHLDGITNTEPVEVKQKIGITYGNKSEINMYNFWDRNNVTDGFIVALDKLVLDDPDPGVPPTQDQKPSIATAPTTTTGSDSQLKEIAEKKNEKIEKENKVQLDNTSGESVPAAKATKERAAKAKADTKINLDNISGDSVANTASIRANNAAEARIKKLFVGNVYGFSASSLTGAGFTNLALDAGKSILNKIGEKIGETNIFQGLTDFVEDAIEGLNNIFDGPPKNLPGVPGNDSIWNSGPSKLNTTGKPAPQNFNTGESLKNVDKPSSPNTNIYD